MNFSDDALRILAERTGWSWAEGPDRLREQLEASLVPMIRCAIRSGRGLGPLVQWVRRHLPAPAEGEDPARAAPEMARVLSSAILRQLQRRRAAAETLVGA